MDPVGCERGEDHGKGLLDGIRVAQWVEDAGAEAGPGADGGHAGAAELLMVIAECARGEGGRLALEAVGFGVAAEWVIGVADAHWFVLLEA